MKHRCFFAYRSNDRNISVLKQLNTSILSPWDAGYLCTMMFLLLSLKGAIKNLYRQFDACTSSLTMLRDWCKENGVTHVAMKSTGIFWKPVFNILEKDFEIILVNARHVKNVPDHKTD